jgi:signal transduction histidine kinase
MKTILQQKILVNIIYIALCLPFFSYAQEGRTIDSIKQRLKKIPAEDKIGKVKESIALGQQYIFSSNYTAAMDCYQQALTIARNINNDSLEAGCYVGLAVIAYYQHDLPKDSLYNFKALTIFGKNHDTLREGKTLRNIAATYAQQGDLANANKYFGQSSSIFMQLHQLKLAAGIYSNMAAMYRWNLRKSIELEWAAKEIWDKDPNDGVLPAVNLGNLGSHYFYLVKFDSLQFIKHDALISASASENLERSERYLRQSIQMAGQNNDINHQSHFMGELSELLAYKGDFKDAYYNIRKYYEIQDSIFSQENKNKIAQLESAREMDVKNKEIVNKELQLSTQRKQRIFFITGLFLLAVIASLLFWQSRIRKKSNTTLVKLNNELNEANKTKAKFFAILSHDLRSPVASLVNFLRLQKKKPDLLTEQQVQNHEQKIEASAESLLETMETMLLWSKGQMENFKPSVQTVPVNSLFNCLEKAFSPTTQTKIAFINPAGLSVVTDENYLQTIMYNLTSNAIKALKHTEHALIEWKAFEQDGKTILSVTDNGPGLTEESMFTLFNETTSVNAKTGLGLHLIRDLARAIQCKIAVTAAPENGTMFTLFA